MWRVFRTFLSQLERIGTTAAWSNRKGRASASLYSMRGPKMATITPFPIDLVPDDELAVQLWELAMAGERGSDAFMRIDAQIRRRSFPQGARRLGTARNRSSEANSNPSRPSSASPALCPKR